MQASQSNTSQFSLAHPNLTRFWSAIVTCIAYVKSFEWVVDIARWIQDTGARIAESAFTLAVMYVTIFRFGHLLLAWVPLNIIAVCNQVCLIVFTIMPELVMVSIIITTFDHWSMAKLTRKKQSYIWCGAYALLTLLFVTLTLFLLAGLQNGFTVEVTQATGSVFVLRCFAGLFYTVLQKLWHYKGKETYTAHIQKLQSEIVEKSVLLSETTVSLSEKSVLLLEMSQERVKLEQEKMSLSLALAGKKVTRKSNTPQIESNTVAYTPQIESNMVAYTPQIESNMVAYTPHMESNTASTRSTTPSNITDMRYKLKHEITQVVTSGGKVNYTEIGKSVGVHPNTVRKHAPAILTEISQGLHAVNS